MLILRKKLAVLINLILVLTIFPTVNSALIKTNYVEDLDPLTDITVTVEIQAIRFLEKEQIGKRLN